STSPSVKISSTSSVSSRLAARSHPCTTSGRFSRSIVKERGITTPLILQDLRDRSSEGGLEGRSPSKTSSFPPGVGGFAAHTGRKKRFLGEAEPLPNPHRVSPVILQRGRRQGAAVPLARAGKNGFLEGRSPSKPPQVHPYSRCLRCGKSTTSR